MTYSEKVSFYLEFTYVQHVLNGFLVRRVLLGVYTTNRSLLTLSNHSLDWA